MTTLQSLFPYPGGKSAVVAEVHRRMGRVTNRVEPFAGTAVWTLSAPQDGATETLNDADGFITNAYRAIATDASAVARWVAWPVSELDLHSRHRWLVDRRDNLEARLRSDPDYFDAQSAGWWLWGICQWIGDGWCPRPHPGISQVGNLYDKIPHLGNAGRGVHRASHAHPSLPHQIPFLSRNGMGIQQEAYAEPSSVLGLLQRYQARLARVRICCGDWQRVLGPSVTERHGITAIFLDPPYPQTAMEYAGGADVWHAAMDWAIANGDNPKLRIALCGYDAPGLAFPDGWVCWSWKARGGYGSQGNGIGRENAKRERIWFSPFCINETPIEQMITAAEATA